MGFNNKNKFPMQDKTINPAVQEMINKRKEKALLDAEVQRLKNEYESKLEKLEEQESDLRKRIEEVTQREKDTKEPSLAIERKANEMLKVKVVKFDEEMELLKAQREHAWMEEWNNGTKARTANFLAELETKKLILQDNIDTLQNNFEQIQDNLNNINKKYSKALEEKKDFIIQGQQTISDERKRLEEEYKSMFNKLAETKKKYANERAELDADRMDLEEEQEYISELKKRYNNYSESRVLALEDKIKYLESLNNLNEQKVITQVQELTKLKSDMLSKDGRADENYVNNLEKTIDELRVQLDDYANMPSLEEVEELKKYRDNYYIQKDELNDVKSQLTHCQNILEINTTDKMALENARTEANVLKALNDDLQQKLEDIAAQYKNNHESKFKGLLEIDDEKKQDSLRRKEFNGSLKDLVDYVRNYGASSKDGNSLYYSEETIRVFITSLAVAEPASRLLILQGLSGTGKSSLPKLFNDALGIKYYSVSVQPSWRDNRELLGYDNDFTNRFKETEFTKILYRASRRDYSDDIVFVVLDEMNLARIEYYFADFLSELEHNGEEWKITLVPSYSEPDEDFKPRWLNYDNGAANLAINKNVWFIGTANNDDSTSLITDKVYDRAQILDMDEREKDFKPSRFSKCKISLTKLRNLFDAAHEKKEYLMDNDDWKKIESIDEDCLQPMDITFGNRMKKQLEDFVPVYMDCGGTKENAIDYFLAHKILRKLEDKYDAYILKCLDELLDKLDSIYPDSLFEECHKKIETIKKRNFNIGEN